ncbi:chemokine XC receptor 1-like [Rhinoraja longicauda]
MSSTVSYYDYESYYTDENFVPFCDNHESILFGEIFTQVLYSLIFIFCLIGNILVFWILMKYEKLKTVTNIFILNLVISDLLFACSLPFWTVDHTHGWIFGKAMCKIMSSVFFVSYYSGIMLLTLMTVDRYFVVVHPLSAVRIRTIYYSVVACLLVWYFSILATIPDMVFSDIVVFENQSLSCGSVYPKESEEIWRLVQYYQQNLLFFLIPFVIIVYCYYRIFNTVVKCRARKKFKAVKVIFCIVAGFFVCWAPYNVVIFLQSLDDLKVLTAEFCGISNHLVLAFFICRNLAYFHCCLNPFFYALVGTKFRKHLKKIISMSLPYHNVSKHSKYRHRSRHLSSSHDYSNSSGFNTIYL